MSADTYRPAGYAPAIWRLLGRTVVTDTGCWQAYRGLDEAGYSRLAHHGVPVRGHRISYEHFIGPIPAGLEIDHLCRNRACVNPDHLEAVTRKENILRGNGCSAIRARLTECPNGHAYTAENTRRAPDGGRRCRICGTAKNARKWQRQLARRAMAA